jgi:hypothetical protein
VVHLCYANGWRDVYSNDRSNLMAHAKSITREWKSSWSKADHEELYEIKISDDVWSEIVADLDDAVANVIESYTYNE